MLRKYSEYIILLSIYLFIIFFSNISYFIMPNDIDMDIITENYCNNITTEYNELLNINNINYNSSLNLNISKVMYRDIYDYNNYIAIYKGSNDNLVKNMAVINEFGLVGIIDKVNKNNSIVKLITNIDSNISVKINNNFGILKVSNNKLIVSDISNYNDINIGDKIYTSGLGNVIGDLYVGEVSDISLNSTNIEKIITVKSNVDFNNIKYIAVVKWLI